MFSTDFDSPWPGFSWIPEQHITKCYDYSPVSLFVLFARWRVYFHFIYFLPYFFTVICFGWNETLFILCKCLCNKIQLQNPCANLCPSMFVGFLIAWLLMCCYPRAGSDRCAFVLPPTIIRVSVNLWNCYDQTLTYPASEVHRRTSCMSLQVRNGFED